MSDKNSELTDQSKGEASDFERITIRFCDEQPTVEGLYLFRKSKRHTKYSSWRLVKLYLEDGLMWVETPDSVCTNAIGINLVGTGQFSINRFDV